MRAARDKQHAPRMDGPAGIVDALVAASRPAPAVPKQVKLRPGDMPFWDGILQARIADAWTPAELVLVAQLARCQADIERLSQEVDEEEASLMNRKGTPVVNPKFGAIECLVRRELNIMRALRLTAASQWVDPRDSAANAAIIKQAQALKAEAVEDADGLLAEHE